MANFNPLAFLHSGLNQFTPAGGFGIPNIGALQALLREQSAAGLRRTNAQDLLGLQRSGMGRSVAGAFSPGTRGLQFNRDLLAQLQRLYATNAQMAQGQRNQLLGTLAGNPLGVAYQEHNKPSFLSSLLGNLLGTGATLFGPRLASKVMGPSDMEKLIMQMFSQNSGNTAAASPAPFTAPPPNSQWNYDPLYGQGW